MRLKDAYAARHEPEALRILAQGYWAFLLTFSSICAVCAIAYGTWEFFRLPERDESLSVRPRQAFTKSDLQALLKKYDERAAAFEARRIAPVSVKDPS